MTNGPTPERTALDRVTGAFRRLTEKRSAPPAAAPDQAQSPPPAPSRPTTQPTPKRP